MVIREITPPVKRIFQMDLGEKELAVIRKGLSLLMEKEEEERQQQMGHKSSIDPDTPVDLLKPVPMSEDEKTADHLLSNIRHTERARLF